MKDDEPEEDIILSKRYRRFFITGMGRTIITRLFSLLYIIAIANLIPLELLDQMVIISSAQTLIVFFASFGMNYSLTRQAISLEFPESKTASIAATSLFFGIPLSFITSLLLVFVLSFDIYLIVFLSVVTVIQYFIQVGFILSEIDIRTDIGILSRTVFSIANSILVPSLFLLIPNFSGILIAWFIASILALLFLKRYIISLFKYSVTKFKELLDIVAFGYKLYLARLFNQIVSKLDIAILFILFNTGDTSLYYYALKLGLIANELLVNIILGIFPLITKIYSTGDHQRFKSTVNSIIRIGLLVAVIYYTLAIYNSQLVIRLILGQKFVQSTPILKIVLVGFIFHVVFRIMEASVSAEGKTEIVSTATILSNLVQVGLIAALLHLGSIGLAIAYASYHGAQALYYLVFYTDILEDLERYSRLIIFCGIILFLGWIFPTTANYLDYIPLNSVLLLLIGISLFFLKPLHSSDWSLIERVVGKRFTSLMNISRKWIVH